MIFSDELIVSSVKFGKCLVVFMLKISVDAVKNLVVENLS